MSEHTRMMVVAAMKKLQEVLDRDGNDFSGSSNGSIGMAIDMLKMAKDPPAWAEAIQPGVTKIPLESADVD